MASKVIPLLSHFGLFVMIQSRKVFISLVQRRTEYSKELHSRCNMNGKVALRR